MAQVTLKNISKFYGSTQVLRDVNLHIEHGELAVLVGPSGCGKSTLLRMLSGLEPISEGELIIGDEVVNKLPPAQRGIAMVFQSYALYPHMNVYKNMAFGLKIHGSDSKEIEARVQQAAKVLHIDHLLQRLPRELSGGQRQRVAIGRAIVRKPKLFLFDEPLSNLDAALRAKTRIELARLHRDLGATMVYVTHDQVEAMTLGDKIVVLNEGRVQQAGSPLTLYQQPANKFVATFIGSPTINLLPAKVVATDAAGALLQLADGSQVRAEVDASHLHAGEDVEIGLRAEHCQVLAANQTVENQHLAIETEITLVEHLGESNLLYLSTTHQTQGVGQELVVRSDGNAVVCLGDKIRVYAPPAALYLFKANGEACQRLNPGNMVSAHKV